MLKAKITNCPNKRMTGLELRRLRNAGDLSKRELAERFGTYPKEIQRLEKTSFFEMHPERMEDLLKALGASSL